MVFQMIGIPGADHIMNAVVLGAIISSMNSGLYGSSASVYTSRGWSRSEIFPFIQEEGTCSCNINVYFRFIWRCIDSLIAGSKTFDFLMGSLGYTVLFIWLIIAFAH